MDLVQVQLGSSWSELIVSSHSPALREEVHLCCCRWIIKGENPLYMDIAFIGILCFFLVLHVDHPGALSCLGMGRGQSNVFLPFCQFFAVHFFCSVSPFLQIFIAVFWSRPPCHFFYLYFFIFLLFSHSLHFFWQHIFMSFIAHKLPHFFFAFHLSTCLCAFLVTLAGHRHTGACPPGFWAACRRSVLVQTGDVVDRGPDTRYVLDYLDELGQQARRGVAAACPEVQLKFAILLLSICCNPPPSLTL